jgi:succinyl-CoA synthetase beta subunit
MRSVDLFEWQGKRLFESAGIPVPRGMVAHSVTEAEQAAKSIGYPVVVKAQVLGGGRGKAGGVRVAGGPGEIGAVAAHILGLRIGGHPVRSLLVEEVLRVRREIYLAVTLDRRHRRPLLLLSAEGGMEIEEVARRHPEALLRVPLDPLLDPAVAVQDAALSVVTRVAETSGQGPGLREALLDLAVQVHRLYRDRDATLVELNPLALVDDDGLSGAAAAPAVRHGDGAPLRLLALDAKVSIDDNALFRQRDLAGWRSDEDDRERRAREAGITYLTLDGDIGVIGNGAGLVMSTIDLLAAAGGRAADFCDIGGGARAEQIAAALQIVSSDSRVGTILVNVFGGITRGDEVARGLVAGLERLDAMRAAAGRAGAAPAPGHGRQDGCAHAAAGSLPIVVRLDGNNAASGRRILAAERPDITAVETPVEAVERAVALARAARSGAVPSRPDARS